MQEVDEDIIELPDPVPKENTAEEPMEELMEETSPMELIFQRNSNAHRSVQDPPTKGSGITHVSLGVISPGKPLTDQMKRDNWQLYVLARSNDPAVMVPNTRKLISNLVQSAKKMQDWSRNNDLVFAIKTSQEAWYEYSEEKNWGFAVQLCETVLDRIGDLLYETDWAMGQSGSFAGPGNTGGKK
jgi:hypothetical protein